MSQRVRLRISLVLLLGTVAAMACASFAAIAHERRASAAAARQIADVELPAIELRHEMSTAFAAMKRAFREATIHEDLEILEESDAARASILRCYRQLPTDHQAAVADLPDLLAALHARGRDFATHLIQNPPELTAEIAALSEQERLLGEALEHLKEHQRQNVERLTRNPPRSSRLLGNLVLVIMLVGVGLAILFVLVGLTDL